MNELPKLDALVAAIHNALQLKLDSKASALDFAEHTTDSIMHLSASDRTKLNNLITNAEIQATYATIAALNAHVNDGYIHLDTTKINNMFSLFNKCSSLKKLIFLILRQIK